MKGKMNICGSVNNLPGENLWNAVMNARTESTVYHLQIGIPPHRIPEAEIILKKALNQRELDLVAFGYGINQDRMSQKDIGEKFHIPQNDVSALMKEAIKKLARAPYFNQLKALVPTSAELYASLEADKGQRKLGRQLRKMEEQMSLYQKTIDEKEKIILEMSERIEEDERRSAAMRKQLDDYSSKNLELMKQLEKYQYNFSSIEQICGQVNKSTIEVSRLQLSKYFSEEILVSLNRAGIVSFDGLLASSRRNLIALKVRKEFVDVIEGTLRQIGLKLRGA